MYQHVVTRRHRTRIAYVLPNFQTLSSNFGTRFKCRRWKRQRTTSGRCTLRPNSVGSRWHRSRVNTCLQKKKTEALTKNLIKTITVVKNCAWTITTSITRLQPTAKRPISSTSSELSHLATTDARLALVSVFRQSVIRPKHCQNR